MSGAGICNALMILTATVTRTTFRTPHILKPILGQKFRRMFISFCLLSADSGTIEHARVDPRLQCLPTLPLTAANVHAKEYRRPPVLVLGLGVMPKWFPFTRSLTSVSSGWQFSARRR